MTGSAGRVVVVLVVFEGWLGLTPTVRLEPVVPGRASICGPLPDAADAAQAPSRSAEVAAAASIGGRARTGTVHRRWCPHASHAGSPGQDRPVNRSVAPTTIAPPAARYSHAVLSVSAERLLHTSGVVPIAPGGEVPE